MSEKYEVPYSTKEIFENKNATYKIINYKMELDNIQALQHFVEIVGIKSEDIVEDNGTEIIIKHDDYDYLAVIDSSGLGDFYSHQYEVKFVKKVNDDYIDHEVT